MTTTQDYTKMMQDFMGAFPMDMSAMQDSWKSYATFGEKMSKVALDAAEKSTEISSKWTHRHPEQDGQRRHVKEEPSDYSKASPTLPRRQAELTAETLAAFAEIAKKVQMETVELMLAAGKDAQEDATAAMKKAGSRVHLHQQARREVT